MEILWNTHVYNRKVLLKSLKKEKFTNKNGSHSALNIFTEYSMTDPGDLAEYFGFTEQEISALCEKYEMSFEEAKTWYDGYQLITHRQTGDEIYSMYSPKSVVEAMLRHKFGTYWNQTETYEALKIYIQTENISCHLFLRASSLVSIESLRVDPLFILCPIERVVHLGTHVHVLQLQHTRPLLRQGIRKPDIAALDK